jgi:predicted phosphodiesterase
MLRRIGLIGDIHAEDVLLERALDFLEARSVEIIATTGDLADGNGSVNKCCELIESQKVMTVRGNHDRWLLAGTSRSLPGATPVNTLSPEARAILERLPRMVELSTIAGRALLCHGLGPNDMAKVGLDDFGYSLEVNSNLQNLLHSQYYRWILNGHSHHAMVRHFKNVTIVNAGSLRRDHEPAFFELDFGECVIRQFDFDSKGQVCPITRVISPVG